MSASQSKRRVSSARCASKDSKKPPSIAETLDWARALQRLGIKELNSDAIKSTLGVLLKHEDDRAKVESKAGALSGRCAMTTLRDELLRFVNQLRSAGVRISIAETLDAMNAIAAAGSRTRADARGARRHPHQG